MYVILEEVFGPRTLPDVRTLLQLSSADMGGVLGHPCQIQLRQSVTFEVVVAAVAAAAVSVDEASLEARVALIFPGLVGAFYVDVMSCWS